MEINGNLTVNGLVNGVNLSSLQSSTGALKSSSGGGLNLNIAFGSYRLNGNITNYPGGTLALVGNATNYVFFGSGGITKNTTGFPTDESFIPVSQVMTSAGSITFVTDSDEPVPAFEVGESHPRVAEADAEGFHRDGVG